MQWLPDEILNRFELISDEIIASAVKTRNVIFVVICSITMVLLLILFSLLILSAESVDNSSVFIALIISILLLGVMAMILQLSTHECETNVRLCKLYVHDEKQFLAAIARVGCGANAIKAFLHLADSALSRVKLGPNEGV